MKMLLVLGKAYTPSIYRLKPRVDLCVVVGCLGVSGLGG